MQPRSQLGLMTGFLMVSYVASARAQVPVAPSELNPAPPVTAASNDCFPPCRAGYVCGGAGQCISACNPPCAANEECTAAATCALVTQPTAAAPAPPPAVPPLAPVPVAQPYGALEPPAPRIGGTNLHVNLLGLVQFGLIPRLESGGATTFLIGVHLFNTGALSYLVIPDEGDSFVFGFGANLGLRHYVDPRGEQRGFFFGTFVEYAHVKTEDDHDDFATYTRGVVVPAVELGSRWVWGSVLLDFGLLVGAAVPVSAEDAPIGPDGCRWDSSCLEETEVSAYGMLTLDVGIFL